MEWRRRDTEAIRRADALSRVEDASDYALSFSLTRELRARWGTPSGDAFAGPWAHSQKAPLFFTASPCHVGCGFDATIRDWGVLGPLVWVFPPVWLLREAIGKILQHRCAAILLVAAMGPHQWPLVRRLPIVDSIVIPPRDGMFEEGSKFSKKGRVGRFKCTLHCFRVQF